MKKVETGVMHDAHQEGDRHGVHDDGGLKLWELGTTLEMVEGHDLYTTLSEETPDAGERGDHKLPDNPQDRDAQ